MKEIEVEKIVLDCTAQLYFDALYAGDAAIRTFHAEVNGDPAALVGRWSEAGVRTVQFVMPMNVPAMLKKFIGKDSVPVVETQQLEWLTPGKAFKVVSEPQLNHGIIALARTASTSACILLGGNFLTLGRGRSRRLPGRGGTPGGGRVDPTVVAAGVTGGLGTGREALDTTCRFPGANSFTTSGFLEVRSLPNGTCQVKALVRCSAALPWPVQATVEGLMAAEAAQSIGTFLAFCQQFYDNWRAEQLLQPERPAAAASGTTAAAGIGGAGSGGDVFFDAIEDESDLRSVAGGEGEKGETSVVPYQPPRLEDIIVDCLRQIQSSSAETARSLRNLEELLRNMDENMQARLCMYDIGSGRAEEEEAGENQKPLYPCLLSSAASFTHTCTKTAKPSKRNQEYADVCQSQLACSRWPGRRVQECLQEESSQTLPRVNVYASPHGCITKQCVICPATSQSYTRCHTFLSY
ncbi:hypothetical protein VOLCADRAFT_105873 [Volvox carteri f. nagariensis]|uniref:VASt domain-containing protein n=1 Tax=Volvox carteri f. nagariensis TaxID=3068 RepID=D8U3T2_VOLCA|nr:uncharacterized protein VOLCADRAFT_105873 [Volvox carteri f. nagariensis]EFJ45582.1 hypothetical protein VOLCADRAFT_105873 [Volvox carteri f. nagariensis]|eukprot:XP_002953272.1 hypothetical protein VOLCADRAFT_105873 [Volvox carteri f. nagariensis]